MLNRIHETNQFSIVFSPKKKYLLTPWGLLSKEFMNYFGILSRNQSIRSLTTRAYYPIILGSWIMPAMACSYLHVFVAYFQNQFATVASSLAHGKWHQKVRSDRATMSATPANSGDSWTSTRGQGERTYRRWVAKNYKCSKEIFGS